MESSMYSKHLENNSLSMKEICVKASSKNFLFLNLQLRIPFTSLRVCDHLILLYSMPSFGMSLDDLWSFLSLPNRVLEGLQHIKTRNRHNLLLGVTRPRIKVLYSIETRLQERLFFETSWGFYNIFMGRNWKACSSRQTLKIFSIMMLMFLLI